jgi:hypothetical protein
MVGSGFLGPPLEPVMAKKRANKVEAVQAQRTSKPIRLDLPPDDFERLERCAKKKGLTKSSYARMAVLEYIRADEAKAS